MKKILRIFGIVVFCVFCAWAICFVAQKFNESVLMETAQDSVNYRMSTAISQWHEGGVEALVNYCEKPEHKKEFFGEYWVDCSFKEGKISVSSYWNEPGAVFPKEDLDIHIIQ